MDDIVEAEVDGVGNAGCALSVDVFGATLQLDVLEALLWMDVVAFSCTVHVEFDCSAMLTVA